MDRAFNFFDHPSPLRQASTGSVPQNTSPSLLPHNSLLPHQQLSNSQTQQTQHQSQPHRSRHQQLVQQQARADQQSHHQSSNRRLHQHAHQHHHASIQQHAQNQRPSPHHRPMLQHLHLQSLDTRHQDSVSSATVIASSRTCSDPTHPDNQSRHQPPSVGQHVQTHQLPSHHLQQPHGHHHAQHGQGRQRDQLTPAQQPQHISGFHMSQTVSPVGSLGVSPSGNANTFPGTSAFMQNPSQFGPTLTRDNLQPTPFQIHSERSASQPGMEQPSNSNNSLGGSQSLQMQPLLPGQQPSPAPFGNLANIPSAMLPGNVGDDPTVQSQQFSNSQAGEALSGPYPWDPSQSQNSLGSQTLTGSQNHHQSLLPLPLGADARATNALNNVTSTAAFVSHGGSGQSAFGGVLSTSVGVLGSSLNSAMVTGLNSRSNVRANLAPEVSCPGTERSLRNDALSVPDGAARTGRTVKKSRCAIPRKTMSSRGRGSRTGQPVRVPIISAVTPAALPHLRHLAPSKDSGASPIRSACPARCEKGSAQVRDRVADASIAHREDGTSNSVAVGLVPPASGADTSQCGSSSVAGTSTGPAQPSIDSKNAASTVTWPMKKSSSLRARKGRKAGDTATTIPVHLRNPKKGRARVFRECKQCKSDNHIRRSDCVQCKAPLPAGKRRRDGNASYDKKNVASSHVPSSQVVSGHLGQPRSSLKEDIAISSVADK